MNKRMWKWTALFVSGGIILQLGGGCVALFADLAIQQLPTILLGLLSQLLTSSAAA